MAPDDFREARIQYAAMISYLDDHIARVLEAAESLPGETLVLYWSDHGEAVGDNGNIAKGCLAETSLRVPFIVAPLRRGECGINCGRVVSHPVSTVDLAPTLCDLSESAALPDVDGDSLRALIQSIPDNNVGEGSWSERPVFS